MSVDAGFGGDAALKKLISEAKKYGIRIILDGVFNHTGADSIYFNKYSHYGDGGAYNSKSSLYYEWYDFKSYPHLYESWWGIEILPRIKTGSESFHKFIAGEGGVVEKYMKLGILGFRLDVVDELEDGFVEDIKSRQNEISKDNLLFGEVWEDASNKIAYGRRKRYFLGAELDGVMNYPLCRGITDFVRGEGISALEYALFEVYRNAPKRISNTQMNLLGSHDTPRILTVLSNGYNPNRDNSTLSAVRLSENEKRIGKERLKLAYALISTLPGLPMIYYGDEAGVEGYSDPFNRLPFPWEKRDRELVEFFKKIGMIRRKNNVYKDGNLKIIALDKEILIFARLNKKYAYITVAVVGDTEVKIKFSELSQNILDDSASLMYNLNKNSVAIFKTSSKVAMYFKKGKL